MRTRREFLARAGALVLGVGFGAPALRPSSSLAQEGKGTRLILLGTKGGPRPNPERASTSQVILVGDAAYVVDCGDGVPQRLVAAGVRLDRLEKIFITHHHSDHNADYGNLLLLSWTAGLRTPVETYGPPPLEEMTRLFFELNAYDIEMRTADEGRVPLVPLVTPKDIREEGVILEEESLKVTATLVHHPPVTPAFAYRFDTPDRSIVISGDTAWSDSLLNLARGVDVLVHEALYEPAIDRLVSKVANASRLKEHILASHTSAEDVGRLAARAGVETLVLSHLVPGDDPAVTERMWREEASKHFPGEIVIGTDLLEI